MPGAAGRRARLRAELLAEIRTAALVELRRTGAAELSLREVARAAGISPAGLYRYVDGRDGLLELLISDGFDSFGATIRSSLEVAGDDPVDRLRAVALGYRRWALDNPEQFGLILGTPVTGIRAHVVLESCARATWCSVKSLPPKGSNHFDGLTRNEQVRSSILLSGSNRPAVIPCVCRGSGRFVVSVDRQATTGSTALAHDSRTAHFMQSLTSTPLARL